VPDAQQGEIWTVDLAMAAKVRPCLLLTDFPAPDISPWDFAPFGQEAIREIAFGDRSLPRGQGGTAQLSP
jgi:mRNA-degrading endonuclease toxin of MazEF toxin-antitoxin module